MNLPQHNKTIYDKTTANVIIKGEKLKAFPPRWETKQGYPSLPLLYYIVLEVLAMAITEKNKYKETILEKM